MTRSDSPEFRHVVRKLLDPNRLTLAPKTQLTPAIGAQVPLPLCFWRMISRPSRSGSPRSRMMTSAGACACHLVAPAHAFELR
jgi:hypothetical protein